MAKVTFRSLTTAAFAASLAVGAFSWSGPVSAEDEHEHRINACVDGKRHHIQEMEDRHEISHEDADRMRGHSHEECVKEIDGPHDH